MDYLEKKADTIKAIVAGVGGAGYVLGNSDMNWNNAARDDAFREIDKIFKQIRKHLTLNKE